MPLPNFYHQSDPSIPYPIGHVWHFVYLHGAAELHSEKMAIDNGWLDGNGNWSPTDMFVSDQPFPTAEGDYHALLYGMPVLACLRKRYGHMSGRVVWILDPNDMLSALNPENWR
jgi:hypothetical protein